MPTRPPSRWATPCTCFGGTGLAGPTTTIYRLNVNSTTGLPATTAEGTTIGWASAPTSQQLPSPRSGAVSFNANGSIYVIGGVDGVGHRPDLDAVGRAEYRHR